MASLNRLGNFSAGLAHHFLHGRDNEGLSYRTIPRESKPGPASNRFKVLDRIRRGRGFRPRRAARCLGRAPVAYGTPARELFGRQAAKPLITRRIEDPAVGVGNVAVNGLHEFPGPRKARGFDKQKGDRLRDGRCLLEAADLGHGAGGAEAVDDLEVTPLERGEQLAIGLSPAADHAPRPADCLRGRSHQEDSKGAAASLPKGLGQRPRRRRTGRASGGLGASDRASRRRR